jgi:hypothetical protein
MRVLGDAPTPILSVMDDFRGQLSQVVDAMVAENIEPVFLVVDLIGVEYLKRQHGTESLDKFRDAAAGTVEGASQGGAAIAYGEGRIVGILPGHGRLKTFAIIEKLRRALPMLGQSFDCILQPDFDVLEYDETTGIAGVMAQLVTRPLMPMREAA